MPTTPEPSEPPSRASDLLSFEALFREHAAFVWRVLRRLGVRDAEVDDLCQEVFLVVHRRIGSFHGGSSVRTWMYGICTRVASEHRRSLRRRREQLAGDDRAPDRCVDASQDAEVDRNRALVWLDRALDLLDDDKRAVFVLFEIESTPMAEVAAAVGCPVQTAYARLYAARKIVEAEMARIAGVESSGGGEPSRPERRSER
jgi:RNA polymerase sigma-70 factor (ECF subfamily)